MAPNPRQGERDVDAPVLLGVEGGAINDGNKLSFSTPQRVNGKGGVNALLRERADCGAHILPLMRDPLHDAADAIIGPVDGHAGKTLPILPASAGEAFAHAACPLAEERRKEKTPANAAAAPFPRQSGEKTRRPAATPPAAPYTPPSSRRAAHGKTGQSPLQ